MNDDEIKPLDEDPIVAEVRRIREELAADFNYDLKAIFEEAHRRTEEARRAGAKVVTLPPKRPPGWSEQAKQLG